MNTAVVGVIGHVDHGKTALVRALTGTETDRLEEEKRRGISIALGFAALRTGGAIVDLIDMPGHERFVRTMISGATGLDGVLVVVDANEGIRPQTREHLDIAQLIGVRRGLVALTKADLAGRELLAARELEITELIEALGFEPMPVVICSAVTGAGMGQLAHALGAVAGTVAPRTDCGFAYLPIDRAFAVPGFGPVVTGTLRRSSLVLGDEVEIVPAGLRASVRSLQIHGETVDRANPGRRTAVALRGVALRDLRRGLALATPGAVPCSEWLDVSIRVLESAPAALENGQRLQLLFGATEVGARLRLLQQAELRPGERAVAQLRCAKGVAVPAREPFILRSPSPPLTVAGGTVLSPVSHRRRRSRVPEHLEHLAAGEMAKAVAAMLRERGLAAARLEEISRAIGLSEPNAAAYTPPSAVRLGRGVIIEEAAWLELKAALQSRLAELHCSRPMQPGHAREMLRLPVMTSADVSDAALNRLVATGEIVCEHGLFRLREFDPRMLPLSASDLAGEIERTFLEGWLSPPDPDAVVSRNRRKSEALHWLMRTDTLVKTTDRVQRRDIVFHQKAVEAAARLLLERLDLEEGFLAREAGAVWGVSRKYSIPLLEHFDAAGLTRRVGDRRFVTVAPAGRPEVSVQVWR